jgi:hypothetical protein
LLDDLRKLVERKRRELSQREADLQQPARKEKK